MTDFEHIYSQRGHVSAYRWTGLMSFLRDLARINNVSLEMAVMRTLLREHVYLKVTGTKSHLGDFVEDVMRITKDYEGDE